MDWVVAVSPNETAGGELAPETEKAAQAAFEEHGCILLRGAFPLATIEAMHRAYRSGQNTVKRSAMTACSWQRGDCVLLDYRTMHAGLANFSQQPRPIMYMVYACPWFFDDVNHINRISLDMSLEHYLELPESAHPLLRRAFSYATRARWHEVGSPGRSAEHNPTKVGRNDPCPCGSGKKFKQRHGRGL